jgi:hypothetical protein
MTNNTPEQHRRLLYIKGYSRIDSIILGQYTVYNNLEERKKERQELVAVLKSIDPDPDRIL